MDVPALAPALQAFGKLIREANARLNKKGAKVRVLVQSDFEHKCFNITFDVVQSIFGQVASLLKSDEIRTAKEILEDIGIMVGPKGIGLIQYLKWKRGSRVTSVSDEAGTGTITIQLSDDQQAVVRRNAVELSKIREIRTAVEGTLQPLGRDGFEKIRFREVGGESTSSVIIDNEDAKGIVVSFDIPAEALTVEAPEEEPPVNAFLRVFGPVLDQSSKSWDFLWGECCDP